MGAPYRGGPVASPTVVRIRWRTVSAALAAIGALSGCGHTAAGSSGTTGPTTPTTAQHVVAGQVLHWTTCSAAAGPHGLQCATLEVPLDYADPAKGDIGISLDRHPASGRAIGSLLTDPGGPGVSGVDYLPSLLTELPSSITDHFNVVGFDPRGVGRSDPVTCGTGRQLDAELSVDPAPPTAAGLAALIAADRAFAHGCESRSGRILPYVSTVDAARDMDRIRAAVGDAKLSYLGFSYGTFLGATYARLFPARVRAMVLDGAIDPALGEIPTVEAQSAALDREIDAFFASCQAGSCGWRPGGDVAAAYDALLARVRAHPVVVAGSDESVGPAALLYGSAAALYTPQSWPLLGQALTALEAGKGAQILALFQDYLERNPDGTYANTVEAETAVDCLDSPAPTIAQLQAAAPATERGAPVFGLLDLYSEITCAVWPVPATGKPVPIEAKGSPPIVVVGSTGDPVTPYVWAQALANQLDRGVLLTRVGLGHTGYGFSSCVRSAVDRYLLTLQPPAPGTRCASD
jgi:pimeloyl-ACP methyl ester carboxylesterase